MVVALTRSLRVSMLAVVLILIGAWFALPGRQLPLYDGVGFPDEPYRFIAKPDGVTETTAAATSIRLTVTIKAGVSDAAFGQTAEQSAQASIFLPAGSITAPGQTSVDVTFSPHAPTAQPVSGTISGNVYRLAVSGGGVIRRSPPGGLIRLRGAQSVDREHVLHFLDGGTWTAQPTERLGTDSFGGPLLGAGDYAAVVGPTGGAASPTPGRRVLLLVGASLLLAVLLLGAVRWHVLRSGSGS